MNGEKSGSLAPVYISSTNRHQCLDSTWCFHLYSSTLKIGAADSSKILVLVYQIQHIAWWSLNFYVTHSCETI